MMKEYPENRLNIHVDEQGNIAYEQDAAFAYFYNRRTREDAEEELEDLRDELAELELNEPFILTGIAHDNWEDRKDVLEEKIRLLEEELENGALPTG